MLAELFTKLNRHVFPDLEFAEEADDLLDIEQDIVFEVSLHNIDFAAKKGGKKKNCSKGYPCGAGCIAATRNCKSPLQGQAKNYAAWLGKPQKGTTSANRKTTNRTTASATTTTEEERNEYGKYLAKNNKSLFSRAKKRAKKIPNSPPPHPQELAAIEEYTGAHYGLMNALLRGELPDIPQEKKDIVKMRIKMASAAIAAMEKHTGTVYRGTSIPADVVSKYKKGAIIEEKAFVSTSEDESIIENFTSESAKDSGLVSVIYKIKPKTGVSVKTLSAVEAEQEVLFAPNTKFKITDIAEDDKKRKIFIMEEV